jgi:hypothetical protein
MLASFGEVEEALLVLLVLLLLVAPLVRGR